MSTDIQVNSLYNSLLEKFMEKTDRIEELKEEISLLEEEVQPVMLLNNLLERVENVKNAIKHHGEAIPTGTLVKILEDIIKDYEITCIPCAEKFNSEDDPGDDIDEEDEIYENIYMNQFDEESENDYSKYDEEVEELFGDLKNIYDENSIEVVTEDEEVISDLKQITITNNSN